jgi:hypothetical protein
MKRGRIMQDVILNVAISNFWQAQNQPTNIGPRLKRIFPGLLQVSLAIESQASDPGAKMFAHLARQNFDAHNIGNSITDNDIATLAMGLQQLAAALKAMN